MENKFFVLSTVFSPATRSGRHRISSTSIGGWIAFQVSEMKRSVWPGLFQCLSRKYGCSNYQIVHARNVSRARNRNCNRHINLSKPTRCAVPSHKALGLVVVSWLLNRPTGSSVPKIFKIFVSPCVPVSFCALSHQKLIIGKYNEKIKVFSGDLFAGTCMPKLTTTYGKLWGLWAGGGMMTPCMCFFLLFFSACVWWGSNNESS